MNIYSLLCRTSTLCLLSATGIAISAHSTLALTPEEEALELAMPIGDTLTQLKMQLQQEPDNLDYYFSYAATAKQMKQYDEAAWALKAMLAKNPELTRVKLELGLVYIEMERFTEARPLFEEARQTNPPKEVADNIDKVLAVLDEREKIHHFSATFIAGANSDSNANAAPSSGNVLIVDTSIPLGAGAGTQADMHGYAAIGLNHTYDIDVSRNHTNWRWKSSLLSYGTEQDTLDNLNLRLYALKTGPEISFPETPVRITTTVGYNHIILDSESYLRNPRFDVSIDYLALPDVIFAYAYGYELRSYLNSATSTTFHDRSGHAIQHMFTMRNILSQDAMLESSLTLRNESAKQNYYANDQAALNVTYMHKIFESAFVSTNAGYKNTSYVIPDLFVSANDREDDEYSAGITFGYNFKSDWLGDFVATTGYQYRDVQSTIENYTYDNHRFMVSFAKEFKY